MKGEVRQGTLCLDCMKILHSKHVWNFVTFHFKTREVRCTYLRLHGFSLLPRVIPHYSRQDVKIFQWLCFQFGQTPIGVLVRDSKHAIVQDQSKNGYRVRPAFGRKERNYISRMIKIRGRASLPY